MVRWSPSSPMGSENVIVWNVCDLNSWARRDVVRELVAFEWPSIVCSQETKLHVISNFDVIQILGSGFDYTYLPLLDSGGGGGGGLSPWKTPPCPS
jgi:hypothetical protein